MSQTGFILLKTKLSELSGIVWGGRQDRLNTAMSSAKARKGATVTYCLLSTLMLALATLYVGWHANRVYTTVQDDIVYPYLFKGFQLHDIVLPAQHANILKFPLFWLQSVLPYTFTTLSLTNLGLLFLTVFGWCFLLSYIFGKRYLPAIFIMMAAVLLGSTSLGLSLIETTIRNIEYPIGLSFIFLCHRLLKPGFLHGWRLVLAMFITVLFTMALAGDNFMLPAFIVPIFIVLAIDWLKTKGTKQAAIVIGLLISVVLLSDAVHRLVSLTGLASYYGSTALHPKIVPIDAFGPSIAHASSQVLDLFGANIFSKTASLSNSIYFVDFALFIMAFCGVFSILVWAFHNKDRQTNVYNRFGEYRFVLAVLATSFFTTFGAYVFSGLVVTKLPDGIFTDAFNIRYIALLPLILIVGVLYILIRYSARKDSRPLLAIVITIVVLVIPLSISSIKISWLSWDNYSSATRTRIQSIITVLETNHVHQIVSGDSLASPIRFWSHDEIKFASIISCDQYMQQNTRLSWRRPTFTQINTALVIDRIGADSAYFGHCSDGQLKAAFGAPDKIEIPTQYASYPTSVEVWVYHYDIRQNLHDGR